MTKCLATQTRRPLLRHAIIAMMAFDLPKLGLTVRRLNSLQSSFPPNPHSTWLQRRSPAGMAVTAALTDSTPRVVCLKTRVVAPALQLGNQARWPPWSQETCRPGQVTDQGRPLFSWNPRRMLWKLNYCTCLVTVSPTLTMCHLSCSSPHTVTLASLAARLAVLAC